MENIEAAVLALALLLTTISIFVYSWFESREQYLHVGIWLIRIISVLPAFTLIIWSIYIMATDRGSLLALALLTASMLLTAGAVQLIALLMRKQRSSPQKNL